MKESKVPGGIQTYSGEGQVIQSQQLITQPWTPSLYYLIPIKLALAKSKFNDKKTLHSQYINYDHIKVTVDP